MFRTLLKSKIHEERLVALLVLVAKFKKGEENESPKIEISSKVTKLLRKCVHKATQ